MKGTGRIRSASQFFGAALIMALGAMAGDFVFSAEPARASSCELALCEIQPEGHYECEPTTNQWYCSMDGGEVCTTQECDPSESPCETPECIE